MGDRLADHDAPVGDMLGRGMRQVNRGAGRFLPSASCPGFVSIPWMPVWVRRDSTFTDCLHFHDMPRQGETNVAPVSFPSEHVNVRLHAKPGRSVMLRKRCSIDVRNARAIAVITLFLVGAVFARPT